jgi:hypothetical protein
MKLRKWSFVWLFAFVLIFASTPIIAEAKSSNALLNSIQQQLQQGKTLNSEDFSVGSSLNDVEAAWGSAEDLSTVAANYWSRHIRFFYDENTTNRTITGIDDFDSRLQGIKLKQVLQKFGEPVSAVEQEGNYYVTYNINSYAVTFVFQSKFINNNPTLELYNVSE